MRLVLYTHSLASDWNHGNAHFLRGILREFEARGHSTLALEPEGGWSRSNLLAEQGQAAIDRFAAAFPELTSASYGPDFDHADALADADVVLVHEWTDPALVAEIGRIRQAGASFTLCFHDTHHRAVSDTRAIAGLDLSGYDLILAFGEALRERYLAAGWGRQVHTWHEAADTRLFLPREAPAERQDLIFVGNWGDGERAAELRSYLTGPAHAAGLTGSVRGVRYTPEALAEIERSGLRHRGWIANVDVPAAFAAHRMTVHVPRAPYVEALPGIPTIRVFEALAAGIPLICAPWHDAEGLFRPGDMLRVSSSEGMERAMRLIRDDGSMAAEMARSGRETILQRHSCSARVDELLAILASHGTERARAGAASADAASQIEEPAA